MKTKLFTMLFLIVIATGISNAQNGYEKSVEVGGSIGVGDYSNNTFGISMINGYRFNDNLYAGIGVGIGYSNFLNGVNIKDGITNIYRSDSYLIPAFANIKFNFNNEKISPFIMLNAGYTFDINQYLSDAPGLMIEPIFGMDFNENIYLLTGFNLQHCKYSYTRNLGTTTDNWDIETKSEMIKAISLRIGYKF